MPIDVVRMPLGPIETNTYLVRVRGSAEAVVVDPSGDATEIRLELARLGARCAAILVTHGHWDHLVGVADLADGTGAPIHMPEGERRLLEHADEYAPAGVHVRSACPDVLLSGGEVLELAGMAVTVLAVPGHSPAHLAYAVDGYVLSGDVLFAGSVGRTDLPGASWDTLLASLRSLVERLPGDTVVCPGHGPETTIGHELATNPFLVELRSGASS